MSSSGTEFRSLYPPFLNLGSEGSAVRHLEGLLADLFFDSRTGTGVMAGSLVEAVKKLQESLGFTDDDVDGQFGPGTRAAFEGRHHISINSIPAGPMDRTHWFNDDGDQGIWPPTGLEELQQALRDSR